MVVAIVLVAQLLPEVVDPLVVVVLVLVVVLPLPQVVDCWVPDLLVVMRVLRLVQVEAVLVALLLQVVQVELVVVQPRVDRRVSALQVGDLERVLVRFFVLLLVGVVLEQATVCL